MTKELEIKVEKRPEPCPACGKPFGVDDPTTACPACAAAHHASCWEEAGERCAACGGGGAADSLPEQPPCEPASDEAGSDDPPPEAGQDAPPDGSGRDRTPPGEEPGWLDEPRNVRRLIRFVLGVCCLLLLLEALALFDVLYHKHGHFDWEDLPGFYAVYGFAAYSAVVALGLLLRKAVTRGEDYYDE
jgi:hypothetical protein